MNPTSDASTSDNDSDCGDSDDEVYSWQLTTLTIEIWTRYMIWNTINFTESY